jgi:hypothetical protein
MKGFVLTLLACLAASLPAGGQTRDEARPRDLQRLQQDLTNLDEDLRGLEAGDRQTDEFRQRAEDIREEVVYLKVQMRRQERAGREGTGVLYDEVVDVQRSIRDLRKTSSARSAASAAAASFASPRARRSWCGSKSCLVQDGAGGDRFEASVFRPVRAEGGLAVPAGVTLRGTVRQVEPARRPSKEGRLELDFDSLYLEEGRVDLKGHVVALGGDDGDSKKVGKAGVGATLGGILGAILGGGKGAGSAASSEAAGRSWGRRGTTWSCPPAPSSPWCWTVRSSSRRGDRRSRWPPRPRKERCCWPARSVWRMPPICPPSSPC